MGSSLATPTPNALAPRTVVANPNNSPGESGVEPGGVLVWTNSSLEYPMFALEFDGNGGRGPASPGDTLHGIGSIVIHVPSATTGIFPYRIRYIPATSTNVDKFSTTFSVHSCIGC
jgi:hypothetical protein